MIKNLLIIGDSYCAKRTEEDPHSWVNLIRDSTGYNIYGKGIHGRGWWQQQCWYDNNIATLPNPTETAVIWCHTSAYRLPCETDASITPWVLQIDDHYDSTNDIRPRFDPDGKLFKTAKEFYTSPLFVEEFYAWAMVAWWKQLSIELLPYNKVIHLFGFFDNLITDNNRLELLAKNSVVVTNPSLLWISRSEESSFVGGSRDDRANHLNIHNNAQLSKFLVDTLNNTPPRTTREINNLDQWELVKNKPNQPSDGSFFKQFKWFK